MNSGRTADVEQGVRRSPAAAVARGARQTVGGAVTVVGSVGCVAGKLLDGTGTVVDTTAGAIGGTVLLLGDVLKTSRRSVPPAQPAAARNAVVVEVPALPSMPARTVADSTASSTAAVDASSSRATTRVASRNRASNQATGTSARVSVSAVRNRPAWSGHTRGSWMWSRSPTRLARGATRRWGRADASIPRTIGRV